MFRRSTLLWKLPVPVLRRSDAFPRYELCVIGGGPGGIAAAMRAASFGKKVCVVEADRLGGRDIWDGTLQSKTLWELSKFAARATTQPGYAESLLDPAVIPKIKAAISGDRIRDTLRQVGETREHKVREMVKRAGIDIIPGKATFNSEREIDIMTTQSGEYRSLSADYFIIATGSSPREHRLCPTDHRRVISSNDIFTQTIPKSMVVVGGGPMGCEFASMYADLGLTQVFLVDRAERILPKEDEDIAAGVHDSLTRRGVCIHQNSQLFELTPYEDEDGTEGVRYSVHNMKTGGIETNFVERALVAVGRVPNYKGLGLENTEMRVRNDHIVVDEHKRCLPYKHIYCLGDAGNDRKLVNMAQASARGAVQHMYGLTPERVVNWDALHNVSTNMFLEDEVACVGLNETQCQQQRIGYIASKYSNSFLARAQVAGESHGFVKLIVTDDRQKRVLGVRAVGSHAASVVETASLAIRDRQSVYDLLRLNPSYPSMVLGLVECARMVVGRGSWNTGEDSDVTRMRHWRPESFERGRAYGNDQTKK